MLQSIIVENHAGHSGQIAVLAKSSYYSDSQMLQYEWMLCLT
ncbi:hypothetical protein GPROT1_02410 [Gammaproteobacteria bacterium]|nr:hypothetical protein GPROT1_02410 [Gammaproteobacteria bacterium]